MGVHEKLPAGFSLGREPALILIGVIAPAATLIVSMIPGLSLPWATGINAAAVALAGAATAWIVRSDRLAPALLGLAQAVITVGLAAGLHLSAAQQAGALAVVGIVVAAFVRSQVAAPVPMVVLPLVAK